MIRSRGWILCLTCMVMFLGIPSAKDRGFEGFGTHTPGGNNGTTVEVTSLQDAGAGTLRAALSSGTNRYIVFKVGGTIMLQSPLQLQGRSYITIDGSTAPAPGITLQGHGLAIKSSNNIIVTHLRVRNAQNRGMMVWDGSYNVVIDHCSVTNSGDENIGITEASSDVTVSWCIIGDTRTSPTIRANHPDWAALKTKGMSITNVNQAAVTRVSLHHNLFTNMHQRSPLVSTQGLFDLRNNVLKEWWSYGMRLGNGAWGNIINNVFVSQSVPHNAVWLEAAGPVYISGNQGPDDGDVNALSTSPSPFAVAPVTTEPVAQVEQSVVEGAGAFPRDAIDTALVGPAPPARSGCAGANLARCATAAASSVRSASFSAAMANDGNDATRWNSARGDRVGAWLALDFGVPTTVDAIVLKEAINRITGYSVQVCEGESWQTLMTGTTIGPSKTHTLRRAPPCRSGCSSQVWSVGRPRRLRPATSSRCTATKGTVAHSLP